MPTTAAKSRATPSLSLRRNAERQRRLTQRSRAPRQLATAESCNARGNRSWPRASEPAARARGTMHDTLLVGCVSTTGSRGSDGGSELVHSRLFHNGFMLFAGNARLDFSSLSSSRSSVGNATAAGSLTHETPWHPNGSLNRMVNIWTILPTGASVRTQNSWNSP